MAEEDVPDRWSANRFSRRIMSGKNLDNDSDAEEKDPPIDRLFAFVIPKMMVIPEDVHE